MLLFLTTNMAAVTSRANQQSLLIASFMNIDEGKVGQLGQASDRSTRDKFSPYKRCLILWRLFFLFLLATAGVNHHVCLWNPYVISKPVGVSSNFQVLCAQDLCQQGITVNALLTPRGAHLFQAHLRGRGWSLIEYGGLFNLEMAIISVLHKELEYKVQSESNRKFQLVNKRFRISPHEILIIWGCERGLLTFFPSKGRGRGVLIEALRYTFKIFYFRYFSS